jgi:hypothetical protein
MVAKEGEGGKVIERTGLSATLNQNCPQNFAL